MSGATCSHLFPHLFPPVPARVLGTCSWTCSRGVVGDLFPDLFPGVFGGHTPPEWTTSPPPTERWMDERWTSILVNQSIKEGSMNPRRHTLEAAGLTDG